MNLGISNFSQIKSGHAPVISSVSQEPQKNGSTKHARISVINHEARRMREHTPSPVTMDELDVPSRAHTSHSTSSSLIHARTQAAADELENILNTEIKIAKSIDKPNGLPPQSNPTTAFQDACIEMLEKFYAMSQVLKLEKEDAPFAMLGMKGRTHERKAHLDGVKEFKRQAAVVLFTTATAYVNEHPEVKKPGYHDEVKQIAQSLLKGNTTFKEALESYTPWSVDQDSATRGDHRGGIKEKLAFYEKNFENIIGGKQK